MKNTPFKKGGKLRRELVALNIEKTFTEDNQVKLTVTIDPARLESAKQRAARKIAQKTRIPGFRPGKAPYAVILRTAGEAALLQEAVDIILSDDYSSIIKEADIRVYGPGSLDNIVSMDPLTLEFTVPLEAKVTLGDYKSIRFPYEFNPVGDEQVNEFIENLQDRAATIEPVDRPAQEADVVFVQLGADRKEPKEDQSVVLIKDRSTTVTIKPEGGDQSNEWPFPGFSRRLLNAKPGDEAVFEYTYGDDSALENLRGSTAIFRYKVEEVKERNLPALDDEFAKSMGEFETLEQMREEVRKGLNEQARQDYNRDYDNKIFDVLIPQSTISFPPQMLEHEIDLFQHQLEHRLEDQGLDMATYLKSRQMDDAGLKEELKPSAEARLRRSLVLFEVANVEQLKVNEEEVQQEAVRTITEINQAYSPKEAKKMVNEQFISNMVGNITSDLLIRESLRRLEYFAKGEAEAAAETQTSETPEAAAVEAGSTEMSDQGQVAEAETPKTEAVEEAPKAKRSKKAG